jgi:hypothetical protein
VSFDVVKVNNHAIFLAQKVALQRVLTSLNQVLSDGEAT